MRVRGWMLVPVIALLGCQSYSIRSGHVSARRALVEENVRRFAATVAHDVTQDGPIAWRIHFEDGPEFFMAVNGKLEFPSGAAAAKAIPEVARVIKHIELHWGDDLRVDVLTPELAVLAATYDEVLGFADGHKDTAHGYFTAVVELRDGRWQFRNAHWSAPVAAANAP